MKKHTRIYMKALWYSEWDYIPCEVCWRPAVDVNHIEPRGMWWSKTKDYIENLQALCRECHIDFESKKISKEAMKQLHLNFLKYGTQ